MMIRLFELFNREDLQNRINATKRDITSNYDLSTIEGWKICYN